MPLSKITFHFFLIVEIILFLFIIIYTYGNEITSHFNLLFDSSFTSFEKLQKLIYNPILLLTRMIMPNVNDHFLFWFIVIPIIVVSFTIFEFIPYIHSNVDIYKNVSDIYYAFVGRRRNNYNFTGYTNTYGNYIPVLLVLIALFIFLNQIIGSVFAFLAVFFIATFFYTTLNVIYMFFIKNNDEIVKDIKKYAINDYIFIVIFAMVWIMLILFLFNASKSIMDSYKFVE